MDILESQARPPRVVAADLDGTLLLNENHELSPATVDAVRVLEEIGITTILVTGRMFRSAERFARELHINGPLVAYQGAFIREVGAPELLHHDPLPLGLAMEILDFVHGSGCAVNVYLDDELFVEKKSAFTERYEFISGMEAHEVGRLDAFLDRPPTKIGMGGDPDRVEALLEQPRCSPGRSGQRRQDLALLLGDDRPHGHEVPGTGASRSAHAFSANQVLAFGDSYNDADMLSWAGTGVAMGDAPAVVAAAADHVCLSVDEDGFTRYLMEQVGFLRDLFGSARGVGCSAGPTPTRTAGRPPHLRAGSRVGNVLTHVDQTMLQHRETHDLAGGVRHRHRRLIAYGAAFHRR